MTSRVTPSMARLTVSGELSMVSAVLLDTAVAGICQREWAGSAVEQLLVDLTDVTFLDVMGVASLRRVHAQAIRHGELRLGLPVSAGPRRLLTVAVDLGWMPAVFRPNDVGAPR